MRQRRVDRDRAQIRVDAEELAKGQQAGLGPVVSGRAIERRVPDRPQEDGVGLGDRGPRGRRERLAEPREGRRPDGVLRGLEPVIEQLPHGGESAESLGGNLGTDPVARQHDKAEAFHAGLRTAS